MSHFYIVKYVHLLWLLDFLPMLRRFPLPLDCTCNFLDFSWSLSVALFLTLESLVYLKIMCIYIYILIHEGLLSEKNKIQKSMSKKIKSFPLNGQQIVLAPLIKSNLPSWIKLQYLPYKMSRDSLFFPTDLFSPMLTQLDSITVDFCHMFLYLVREIFPYNSFILYFSCLLLAIYSNLQIHS